MATARWQAGDEAGTARSNPDQLIVAERLDVALTAGTESTPTPIAAGQAAMPFIVRNTGSGAEAFSVTATANGGESVAIAIDGDGDGRYDATRDPLLTGQTPALAAGVATTLFALPPAGVEPAQLLIAVRAVTGSGAPGTVFPGTGDNGADAVTGPTGAAARLILSLDGSAPQPSLAKTQSVRAPDGSARPVTGAIITYTLSARLIGGERDAAIEDRIPAGTRYVPGSLMLDGASLSDATDGDAGDADDARVQVRLDQPGGLPADYAIQFAVRIL